MRMYSPDAQCILQDLYLNTDACTRLDYCPTGRGLYIGNKNKAGELTNKFYYYGDDQKRMPLKVVTGNDKLPVVSSDWLSSVYLCAVDFTAE